jgi:A/G-specific adenine glycosylase
MPATDPPDRDQPLLPTARFRAELLAWYDRARRDLPWRAPPGAVPDPWHVLVSELMLQQTTVATVRGRFGPFLARFPSLPALAEAPLEEVLHAWQGLGYYRRAQALHACARAVAAEHGGRLPLGAAALAALPGIGPYTAAAVAAIAGGQPVVPVDANVERVLGRVLALERPLPAGRAALRQAAAALAARRRPGDFAQALMDLGALVCTPRRPACLACPVRRWCRAAATAEPEAFPRRAEQATPRRRHATAFLLERPGDGAVLFRRRPLQGAFAGMMELPSTPWVEDAAGAEAAVTESAPAAALWEPVPGEVRHLFSGCELTMRILRGSAPRARGDGVWTPPARFPDLALPTFTARLLRHAGLRW